MHLVRRLQPAAEVVLQTCRQMDSLTVVDRRVPLLAVVAAELEH
jgi:hypothetical protein